MMLGLEKILMMYQKMEMSLISSLAGTSSNVIDETSFYDIGFVQTQIARIQKEMKRITKELEVSFQLKDDSDYGKQHRAEIIKEREQLLFNMIFLVSNSFDNLDDCENLADGHNFKFMVCIQGLKEYNFGNKEKAFLLLEKYYKEYGFVEDHYLVNKVFGILLAENGLHQKSIPFLSYALQFKPDDTVCLEILSKCYRVLNMVDRESVIQEILSVLR